LEESKMRRHLMLSTAAMGLMLASGLAYAQAPGERKDEPKRTEEPAKGAAQRGQGAGQEHTRGAQERMRDERTQGAATREEKGGGRQATEEKSGSRQATEEKNRGEKNRPATAEERNRPKANEQTQETREGSRERNRGAENTKPGREAGKSSAETKGNAEGKSSAETKRESSGTQKSTAESEKSKNGAAGKENERAGTAASQNERNQGQPPRNEAEKQTPAQQGNRPATANETSRMPSSNNAQNAPSTTGTQTNQASRTNNTAAEQQSRITPEKRVRISETFSRERLAPPERDLNVSIRVGEAVPPRVHLQRLPPAIISIEPEYRDYDYFTTDDDIVIVEPGTHRIVSEVPRDPSRARAQLGGGTGTAGGGSMAAAGGGNVNCKIMRRDASGNVASVEPSTVGSSARTNSLSVTVQLPGGGSSQPIALGASAGDIVVATQGQDDCTVTLEPQTR
jgi:hypothetical protein